MLGDLSAEQEQQAKQFVLWTAVAVVTGYVVLFVI